MLEKVAPIADDRLRAEVEAELLRWAAGRVVTPAQLGAKARREVPAATPAPPPGSCSGRLKERGVHLRPHTVDGMATVTVVATMPEAQALYRALIACAEDPRRDRTTPHPRAEDARLPARSGTAARGEQPAPGAGAAHRGRLGRHPGRRGRTRGGRRPRRPGRDDPPAPHRPHRPTITSPLPWQPTPLPPSPRLPAPPPPTTGGPGRRPCRRSWPVGPSRPSVACSPINPRRPNPTRTACRPTCSTRSAATCSTNHRRLPRRRTGDRANPRTPRLRLPRPRQQRSTAAGGPPPTAPSTTRARPCSPAGEKLAHAQRMVRGAIAADDADEAAWQDGPGGRITDAGDALTALLAATDIQRDQLGTLLASTAGGGALRPAPHRPHRRGLRRPARPHRPARPQPRRHLRPHHLPTHPGRLHPRPQPPHRPRATRTHRRLPTRRRPRPLHARPRPTLPLPRLPPTGAPRR